MSARIWAPRWRPWKQVSWPCALNRERSTMGFSRLLLGLAERVEQVVDALVAHEADHFAVVHQHHRRIRAGAQAFALLHRELAVGRRAADLHVQLLADVGERGVAVAKLA